MITILLEKIITILEGWIQSFTSHAQHVEDKLDSLDQTASDIKTNTEPISDIADNTGAVITPIQNIKSNTDSIKQSSQTSANNTTAILNNISTLSTNTGRAAAYAQDCANNTLDIRDKITTIASDTTQLRADTDELNTMSDKIYEAIKWSLADKYIEETVSGSSPVSFDTDIKEDLIGLIVGIVAQQEGTGDPSSTNIRPITGYSNMNLNVNSNNITIALGQTVFGGLIDKSKSILRITHISADLGSLNLTYYSNNKRFVVQINNGKFTGTAFGLNTALCEVYPVSVLSYSAIPDKSISVGSNFYSSSTCSLVIHDETYTNANDLKTALSGKHIIYELNTPIEVSLLDFPEIITSKGINTISTDTNGDIEVTYKESIKHYLDKQDN